VEDEFLYQFPVTFASGFRGGGQPVQVAGPPADAAGVKLPKEIQVAGWNGPGMLADRKVILERGEP